MFTELDDPFCTWIPFRATRVPIEMNADQYHATSRQTCIFFKLYFAVRVQLCFLTFTVRHTQNFFVCAEWLLLSYLSD